MVKVFHQLYTGADTLLKEVSKEEANLSYTIYFKKKNPATVLQLVLQSVAGCRGKELWSGKRKGGLGHPLKCRHRSFGLRRMFAQIFVALFGEAILAWRKKAFMDQHIEAVRVPRAHYVVCDFQLPQNNGNNFSMRFCEESHHLGHNSGKWPLRANFCIVQSALLECCRNILRQRARVFFDVLQDLKLQAKHYVFPFLSVLFLQ